MHDEGGSVTLIFYKVGDKWWREPILNIIAAAAQFSSYTHVELAIGEESGSRGEMANVCRVFNDSVGVVSQPPRLNKAVVDKLTSVVRTPSQELVQRTGRNPGASLTLENRVVPARVARLVAARVAPARRRLRGCSLVCPSQPCLSFHESRMEACVTTCASGRAVQARSKTAHRTVSF